MNELDTQIRGYIKDLQKILNNSGNMSPFEKIQLLRYIGNGLRTKTLDDYDYESIFKIQNAK